MTTSSFERHQNCKYFIQNAWMMSEGKYLCGKTGELCFIQEIPKGCVKGFQVFQYPRPKEEDKIENKCKIYKFKRR